MESEAGTCASVRLQLMMRRAESENEQNIIDSVNTSSTSSMDSDKEDMDFRMTKLRTSYSSPSKEGGSITIHDNFELFESTDQSIDSPPPQKKTIHYSLYPIK